jgi:soluble P-type ATPase
VRDRPGKPPGITVEIPEAKQLRVRHVVFDFNGTLATDGRLIRGVGARVRRLARVAEVIVTTADTFGTAREALAGLPAAVHVVRGGADKRQLVRSLGGEHVAVVGNGANDVLMFKEAVLGIAVCGIEGLAAELLRAATIVVHDINDAIDLLLRPKRLVATLRR